MPDPIELVELAIAQRERGTMHPSMDSYDGAMAQTWGGPPPRWYPAALEQWPSRFAAAAGRRALVTGGTGGIGFYVAKLLCRVGLTVILPSRPDLSHEAASAAAAISAAVPDAAVVVPEVPLDLGSFASVRAFGAHMRASGSAPIDTLVLNAGRGGSSSGANAASVDGAEVIMQVNLLGHALLAAELLPLLNRSGFVRVAAQSSGARFNAREADLRADLGSSLAAVARASPWDQYSKSKAGACLLASAIQRRLAAAGLDGAAVASDPGLAATGVNVQHDLAATLGGRLPDTKALHDAAAHHAADGALPLALAALSGARGAFYATAGRRARSLEEAAHEVRAPFPRGDPAGWGEETVEAFWARLGEATPGLVEAWAAGSRHEQDKGEL